MKTSDFSFNLPPELIAQHPSATRGASRLMVLDRARETIEHRMVADLPSIVPPGTLMVFNDSKVRKARLYGIACSSGSTVEFLLIKQLTDDSWKVMVSKAKRQQPGRAYTFPGGVTGVINSGTGDGLRIVTFSPSIDESYLETWAHIPLPPYIRREDEDSDADRYQTVYARSTGSSAAPTAGLHFTDELLSSLHANGVETAFITLHVGLGTFLPVRTGEVEDHSMHEEEFCISEETASRIIEAKAQGRKILAVGTTSVRTLESAWTGTGFESLAGTTRIFIYPGYRFRAVDMIFTNFHTPESSLLMLVSAFAGKESIDRAYQSAVENRYRFFSYGDAMLIMGCVQ